MKPYLAIIKDSFREALASRVLWVLLGLITLVLATLLPFCWESTVAARLSAQDIRSLGNLSRALLRADQEETASPLLAYIWQGLSETTRTQLRGLEGRRGPEGFQTREAIVADLNAMIERQDFFQAELWREIELTERGEELRSNPNLADDARQQLHRLALEAALPGQLQRCPDEAMQFAYRVPALVDWKLDFIPPLGRRTAIAAIETFVNVFLGVLIGFFGIFAGILITAPIIPNMLDSGTLHVLLSKPVSRPLVFLAKFLGGCSFVFINATYLILGVWLILGIRFDLWKPRVLWAIPIFLFSFAVFYAVSSVAGLVWRSSVMAIVATVVFWLACTLADTAYTFSTDFAIQPHQLTRVAETAGELFAMRRSGDILRWNSSFDDFEVLSASSQNSSPGPGRLLGSGRDLVGMVFDPDGKRLLMAEQNFRQGRLTLFRRDANWVPQELERSPAEPASLFCRDGQFLLVGRDGIFRLSTESESVLDEPVRIFGFELPSPTKGPASHVNLAEGWSELAGDAQATYDPQRVAVYVLSQGQLRRWDASDAGTFSTTHPVLRLSPQIDAIAAGGGLVTVTYTESDRRLLQIFSGDALETSGVMDLGLDAGFRSLQVSRDGSFAGLLSEVGQFWLVDLRRRALVSELPGVGSVTAFTLDEDLVTADAAGTITARSLGQLDVRQQWRPKPKWFEQLYRYLIRPLYVVFPKPSKMEQTMQYAISGKQTTRNFGPSRRNVVIDPWQPVVSNATFVSVMLAVGCLYFYRQEF